MALPPLRRVLLYRLDDIAVDKCTSPNAVANRGASRRWRVTPAPGTQLARWWSGAVRQLRLGRVGVVASARYGG